VRNEVRRYLWPLVVGCLLLSACGGAGSSSAPAVPSGPSNSSGQVTASAGPKPNIVFIVTDDLDAAPVDLMPRLRSVLADQGTVFTNAFATSPICCPSRATMLTGQYPHNHGTWRNTTCFATFRNAGREQSTVATWLKASGYRTGLVGKYLNKYPAEDATYVPAGWDEWYSTYDEALSSDSYFDYSINENGKIVRYGKQSADYVTDVAAQKAVTFIRKATTDPKPFFLWFATSAPHYPAEPAPRHVSSRGEFAPKPESFNEEDMSDKPQWYQQQPRLTSRDIADIDWLYKRRLETLAAVEDAVEAIAKALEETGKLSNTYIVFTSDNGFLLGQHRFPRGKAAPYEESIKLPLIVRGPGVPARRLDHLVAATDLAPTLAELGQAQAPDSVDGKSLAPLLGASPPSFDGWRKDLFAELEADDAEGLPSWVALRARNWIFVNYPAVAEQEYYDLDMDPYQVQSRHRSLDPARRNQILTRIDQYRTCRGASCRTASPF
jgi:N-acetylglucosamine-6-sulfatase